ncbi:protein of unknown function [Roseateles sp. YR242]|uniref:DUF4365 domain-containing protein n=1 Tax=Roseateles sp. YR242 TaxID=1855305 RepID=UPI0008CA97EB|nr:DUF4365 domain-containing protein [Roseateles sp. YR242]SEL82185.1 protein of unknown function [Roseateles sp. YR242]
MAAQEMKPLTPENIESELSYAYLHVVASQTGASCVVGGRHDDCAGIDAKVTAWGPFQGGGYRVEVDLNVQLKATTRPPLEISGCLAYSLRGIGRYDDLRCEAVSTPRILVVLYLPECAQEWVSHTDEALSLHKRAYWVSLRGAKASDNKTARTVYIPRGQRFDADGLSSLFCAISRNDIPRYRELDA